MRTSLVVESIVVACATGVFTLLIAMLAMTLLGVPG